MEKKQYSFKTLVTVKEKNNNPIALKNKSKVGGELKNNKIIVSITKNIKWESRGY